MRPFWLHQHKDAEIVLLFVILFPPVTRNLSSPDIFFFHVKKEFTGGIGRELVSEKKHRVERAAQALGPVSSRGLLRTTGHKTACAALVLSEDIPWGYGPVLQTRRGIINLSAMSESILLSLFGPDRSIRSCPAPP